MCLFLCFNQNYQLQIIYILKEKESSDKQKKYPQLSRDPNVGQIFYQKSSRNYKRIK